MATARSPQEGQVILLQGKLSNNKDLISVFISPSSSLPNVATRRAAILSLMAVHPAVPATIL